MALAFSDFLWFRRGRSAISRVAMVSEPLIRIASGLEPTTAGWNRKPAGQLILLLLLLLIFAREHRAASLPPGFSEEALEGPWTEPVGLTFESEQTSSNGRAYIWERTGKVWIFENGAKQSPPLIDISEEVGGWRDHGLLGFALHPRFRDNGYIFLAYTVDHHHLTKFGTSNYHSSSNEYFMATIHRVTRYTARAEDGFRSVNPASRRVLLGESISNGIPSLYQSHGICSLVFGSDGTLFVGSGDGASYATLDKGKAPETYFAQALAEGIITSKENVGAFRSQLLSSLCGKILRLNPETGDGVPGNPFYEPERPRSARSRIWALGLRNPFRFSLRPGTGSHKVSDADPGVLYVGDVGLRGFEDLNVVTGPGMNFGWPLFEGLEPHPTFRESLVMNRDAPNPLFGTEGCTQEFFPFTNLIIQDTARTPDWTNPCNPAVQIPASIPRFVHTRPAIDWKHTVGPARTGIYTADGMAAVMNIGEPGSPVTGPQFGGTSSIGGVWYLGHDFPEVYHNTYFHADFETQWIRNFMFDASNRPVEVRNFATNTGGVVSMATHPVDGSLWYVTWTNGIKRIRYGVSDNRPPQAVPLADKTYGLSPLTVQFDARSSSDPEGLPLAYSWNFGDGSEPTREARPSHTFVAPSEEAISFNVTLTVTDPSGLSMQAPLLISLNNTPPQVSILSPMDGGRYPMSTETTYELRALISDLEHSREELTCRWTTTLHHNQHIHSDPADPSCDSSLTVSPLGCDGQDYFYHIALTVTDGAGLSTTKEVRLYPDCQSLSPVLSYLGRVASGGIRWQLSGEPTRSYLVEGSTNLTDWTSVRLIRPVGGSMEFSDSSEGNLRFYRAVLIP